MPANATPRFTAVANIASANVDAANASSAGDGNISTPTIYLIFTAGANGSFIEFVRIMVTASVASTAGAATTIRLFISSVNSGATTTANTHLIDEIAIPSITADVSGTATNYFDIPMGIAIPNGMYLLATTHVAANTNTHNCVTAFGGDY
jgi:hypothetical protein